MKTVWGIIFGLILGLVATAAAPDVCYVCGKSLLTGKVWKFKEQLICDECAQIKERCSLCHFPAKAPFKATSDGRFVCRRCEPTTILKLEQAQALWDELVSQIDTMSKGQLVLKQKAVTLSLYDIDYWNSQNGKALPPEMRRAGLSQSRPTSQGMAHAVLLFSGLSRDETRSVLAHEFTHLWINENTAAGRKIDPRTVEGLCELVAYALNRELNIPAQNEFILKNTYTKGRINELVEMEKQYSFKAIMGWVVDSKD
ncbi:MAG TPA: protein DA1, partial [Roseimicrobium sp.]|nr:protein DA1 [Roseimicrobium sp.]